jgi:hypothetical protein
MFKKIITPRPTKVLTVVVLLSLGQESTKREYKLAFEESAIVDEQAEANKIALASRKKYTSIIHLGGNATVFTSQLSLVNL